MRIGVRLAAELAGVRLIDYRRAGEGLLVSSGSGIMMAVMDAVPALRWCCDVDERATMRGLRFFLRLLERDVAPFGVVGWFSITDPSELRRGLLEARARPVVYTQPPGLFDGSDEVPTLDIFLRRLSS